jgi:hypothetical protein
MKSLTCGAVRRRLHAFHDRELAVGDEIAVGAHLEWCETCAAALAELELLRSALLTAAPGRVLLSTDDAVGFGAGVLSRVKAEEDASLMASVRVMFDDMHLVYAGFGAAVATIACVVVMLGMMRFATKERPDSLAAIVSIMAMPLECEFNEVTDASACRTRWMERSERANELAEQDAVFALDSLLIRHGRLRDLERLRSSRRHTADGQLKLIEGLLTAVSRARLDAQPARVPAASHLVWMVARTTVRPAKA